MSEAPDHEQVIEKWIKPPKLIKYSNSTLISFNENELVCRFNLPEKYSKNPFFINGEKILEAGEMFWGKRIFYAERFYSLREYYSSENKLTAYYIDITLPPKIQRNKVLIVDLKIDFWVKPDKKTFFILDQNELEEAVKLNLLSKEEINICNQITGSIKNQLEENKFDEIFKTYEKGSYKDWNRYKEHL